MGLFYEFSDFDSNFESIDSIAFRFWTRSFGSDSSLDSDSKKKWSHNTSNAESKILVGYFSLGVQQNPLIILIMTKLVLNSLYSVPRIR